MEGGNRIMILAQLDDLLTGQGFCKVPSNLPEFSFFFRRESTYVNVLHVIDYKPNLYLTEEQYAHIKEKIREFFRAKGFEEVHILSLLIGTDTEKAKRLCGSDSFCWLIDSVADRLLIHENQVADFYGMKGMLEKFLEETASAPDRNREKDRALSRSGSAGAVKSGMRLCFVNIVLVAVNVILFMICTFTGSLIYNIGDFSVMDLIQSGSWYRMITSMFLHADIGHLVSNMLILYYIGNVVEKHIGHLPYLGLYFLSGLVGNVFSAGYELITGDFVSAIGASGAVFGVEGALLMLALVHRGKLAGITAGRIAFSIAFSLYCGFTGTNIDNAAHVGGLMMGFLMAGMIWLFTPGERKAGLRR